MIDLSPLNGCVSLTPFKMETVSPVLSAMREGDFLASIDLRDAYFQVPIHRSLSKFLRFLSGVVVFKHGSTGVRSCFGLGSRPRDSPSKVSG